MDENTSSEKLAGGYSPLSFALGKKDIRYGIITKSLLKRGHTNKYIDLEGNRKEELIGYGSNLLLDELNRTPFENLSFLMGFYQSPYSYMIEEEGRIVVNPNNRTEFNNEHRWVMFGTMNISDIGNNPLSLAFKRRFHIIRIRYNDQTLLKILRSLFKFQKDTYEEKIFLDLNSTITSWHENDEITFPCGVSHYHTFFTFLRNGLKRLRIDEKDNELYMGKTKIKLEKYLESILRSTIIMPIINENDAEMVAEKEGEAESLAKDYAHQIKSYIEEKSIKKLYTVLF